MGRSISTADLLKIRPQLKRKFLEIATEICPAFEVGNIGKETVLDIFNWCCMLPGRLDNNKGLCLWGNIGTGKSTMLAIVKEFSKQLDLKRSNGCSSFRISNVADEVCAAFEKKGSEGIGEFIKSGAQAFDELGAETIPTGHFGTNCNVMQRILQSRYDKRFTSFTHITTNLSKEGIIKAYGHRIWDRCKEMFNFIEFQGKTLRKN